MSNKEPYRRPYVSSDPSANTKSGGSSRVQTRKGRGVVPLESEEELVYFTEGNSVPLKDNGVMKRMEFAGTDRSIDKSDFEKAHVRLKSWERQIQ